MNDGKGPQKPPQICRPAPSLTYILHTHLAGTYVGKLKSFAEHDATGHGARCGSASLGTRSRCRGL